MTLSWLLGGGGIPLYRLECAAPKGMFFQPFWSEIGCQFRPFLVCKRIWFVQSSLELGMFFLEELATSSSFGGGGSPLYRLVCAAPKGMFFSAVLV